MIHKDRANRRFRAYTKARRKKRLAESWGYGEDIPLHKFSKGKIHCSCPMCQEKTNGSNQKSKGGVCARDRIFNGHIFREVRGSRIPTTHERYGKKNWSHSDKLKIDEMNDKVNEYFEDAENPAE